MEQTKGYLTLRGKVFGLDTKEAYENEYKKSLGFGLRTSKENSIFVQVGEWKNSSLQVKIKGEGMDQAVDVFEQEAIDEIKALFKDNDSVVVNVRVSVNTYKKRLDYIINKIFICDKEIDFDASDFEEKNSLSTTAIVSEPINGEKIKVAFVEYHGDFYEEELTAKDEAIKDYLSGVNVGDLLKLDLKVVNKPVYEIIEGSEEEKPQEVRKTLKGRVIGGNNKNGKQKRKITGREEYKEIIDIDTDITVSNKYTLDDLGKSNNTSSEEDMPF